MHAPAHTLGAASCAPALHDAMDALLKLIESVVRVVVLSHQCPDGDAVGATLAAALILEALGKSVVRLNQDPIPHNFAFLPGADRWTQAIPDDFDPQLVFLVDCGLPSKPGDVPASLWSLPVAVVDHHAAWDDVLAPIAVRDLSASATGELLFHLAQRWNVALSLDLATCLYCCVFTDTGSFRYKSTTPAVLHVAAHLIAAGVNPWEMTSQIYESQPRARVELLRQVLNTLDYSPCGRLSIMRIEHHMLATSGATLEMADGFINHGRGVSGVEVAAQLVELDDPDHWRVSFRSRGAVDVAQLASLFGGGGGKNAAGCLMRGSPREILDQLSAALSSSLDP